MNIENLTEEEKEQYLSKKEALEAAKDGGKENKEGTTGKTVDDLTEEEFNNLDEEAKQEYLAKKEASEKETVGKDDDENATL